MMHVLRLEHSIRDFDTWKQAFDRDPANRRKSGVSKYTILRPHDDPDYIVIDLEFESIEKAAEFVTAMQAVWQSRSAAPALLGTPNTRVFEIVEATTY
jgi:quinol monooxygenase YgiN